MTTSPASRAGQGHAAPDHGGSDRAGPGRAGSDRAGSDRAGWSKADWRSHVLATRRARDTAERDTARTRNGEHLLRALGQLTRTRDDPARPGHQPLTVCTYLSLASEPLPSDLPQRLTQRGFRVLAPVTHLGEPLDWCLHTGYDESPERGAFGIVEPIGPRLGPDAIREAEVVLVPALAIDRSGTRLGRGGGHYDRSLSLAHRPGMASYPQLIAVIFDDELVATLPSEEHDHAVTHVVSPTDGYRPIRG